MLHSLASSLLMTISWISKKGIILRSTHGSVTHPHMKSWDSEKIQNTMTRKDSPHVSSEQPLVSLSIFTKLSTSISLQFLWSWSVSLDTITGLLKIKLMLEISLIWKFSDPPRLMKRKSEQNTMPRWRIRPTCSTFGVYSPWPQNLFRQWYSNQLTTENKN